MLAAAICTTRTMATELDSRSSVDSTTVAFLVELLKDTLKDQSAAVQALDAKAVQIFAAATVVLGLVVTSPNTLAGHRGMLIAALALYVGVAISTVAAIWPRRICVLPSDTLWNQLYDEEVDDARHTVITLISRGYRPNETVLRDKRRALIGALACTGVETLLVALAVTASLA